MVQLYQEEIIGQKIQKKVTHRFRYFNNLTLTGKQATQVNFFEYWETVEYQINFFRSDC